MKQAMVCSYCQKETWRFHDVYGFPIHLNCELDWWDKLPAHFKPDHEPTLREDLPA